MIGKILTLFSKPTPTHEILYHNKYKDDFIKNPHLYHLPEKIKNLIDKNLIDYFINPEGVIDKVNRLKNNECNKILEGFIFESKKYLSKEIKLKRLNDLIDSLSLESENIEKYISYSSIESWAIRDEIKKRTNSYNKEITIFNDKLHNNELCNEEYDNVILKFKTEYQEIDKLNQKKEFLRFIVSYHLDINSLVIETLRNLEPKIKNDNLSQVEYEQVDNELYIDDVKREISTIDNTNSNLVNQIPENLKELLSIWHDRKDIENLLKIYNDNKEIFINPTKKLISCFAYKLNEKNWLTKFDRYTFNATDIAKIFLKMANLKFLPAYKKDFNFIDEEPVFNIKFSKKVNIDMNK